MYVVPLVRPERCFNFFGEANFFSLKSLDFYILVKAYETKLIFGEAIEVNFFVIRTVVSRFYSQITRFENNDILR